MSQTRAEAAPAADQLLDLTGRVALITGARGGIGKCIATRFAAAGAAVIVHYRGGAEDAEAVVDQIRATGGAAESLHADVADRDAVEALVEAGVAEFGAIDIAINNAAVQTGRSLMDLTDAQWDAAMAANLSGAMHVMQAVASHLIERESGGAVVNVASILGSAPRPAGAEYSVSKAGLIMLTRAAAIDYGPHDIRVNAVLPGLIDRDGLEQAWPEGVESWLATAPLGRVGTPEDVADACLFLASPAARWITGASLVVDGGVSARSPW